MQHDQHVVAWEAAQLDWHVIAYQIAIDEALASEEDALVDAALMAEMAAAKELELFRGVWESGGW